MRTWTMPLLLASLAALPAPAPIAGKTTWTFDDDPTGAIARGFAGGGGDWKVVPSEGGRALAQLAASPDAAFNVALAEGTSAKDLDLSVRIQAVAGDDDRGGGLVWRARDARNYYVARFNHLEDNFRVYRVVDGVRSPPLRDAAVKHHDGWTTLRVTMRGNRIECSLDGRKLLDVADPTFPDAGKVGVWSKADARTLFDDLTLIAD